MVARPILICDKHPYAGEMLDHTCYVCKSARLEVEVQTLRIELDRIASGFWDEANCHRIAAEALQS
jgi:hypothetical protein